MDVGGRLCLGIFNKFVSFLEDFASNVGFDNILHEKFLCMKAPHGKVERILNQSEVLEAKFDTL